MGRIVVTEFMTLDGVVESPQLWSLPFWNDEVAAVKHAELMAADAHLLGRVTYDSFAGAWPSRTDEQGFADRMNALPKYVATHTRTALDWNNSHVLGPQLAKAVAEVRDAVDGDVLVAGSLSLVPTLLAVGMVDEVRLLVYPVVYGHGRRLFPESGPAEVLRLLEARPLDRGVVLQRYEPTGQPLPEAALPS